MRIGGFELNTLKKLNGDRLGIPFALNVLANAMGRGATALCKKPCNLAGERSFGSILNMGSFYYKSTQNLVAFFRVKQQKFIFKIT
jgi:hypothetical protein